MQLPATEPTAGVSPFFNLVRNPLKSRLFLLRKLPAAFFSGLRLVSVDGEHCTVSVTFGWFTQNPFRSTYFACLAMAAELSTGVLAMGQVWGRKPAVSMLVTGIEGRFYKKATGTTLFTCSDGLLVQAAVQKALANPAGQTVKLHTVGRNQQGEPVAEFWLEWSFKLKARGR